jgi:hypothetical protein
LSIDCDRHWRITAATEIVLAQLSVGTNQPTQIAAQIGGTARVSPEQD